jgi:hypothetical protein
MDRAWIPRKCFVCGEKGGWGKKNVNAIYTHGFRWGNYWAHFHPHCLKDAICCPGNYKNWIVEQAVEIHNKWEELQLKRRMDKLGKNLDLKKAQEEICKGGIR